MLHCKEDLCCSRKASLTCNRPQLQQDRSSPLQHLPTMLRLNTAMLNLQHLRHVQKDEQLSDTNDCIPEKASALTSTKSSETERTKSGNVAVERSRSAMSVPRPGPSSTKRSCPGLPSSCHIHTHQMPTICQHMPSTQACCCEGMKIMHLHAHFRCSS